jgi:hypothetical protein
MRHTRVNQSLKKQVDGILADIFCADQAYALLREIGQHAEEINQRHFGHFFAPMQDRLGKDYLLSVAKLYDPPHRKYPTRSIRTLVSALKASAKNVNITKSPALRRRFVRAGINSDNFYDLADSAITERLVEWCQSRLGNGDTIESVNTWRASEALRFRRDKVIAHNELLSSDPAPDLTWAQANSLLELARTVLDLVSTGYLNYFLTADDGSFFLTSDVEQAAVCLRRLLGSLK